MQPAWGAVAETLWQEVMALGLPSLAAFSVEILPEIDSTNSELMRRARAGRAEPTLLIAERQSAGRGRLGRVWESAAGHCLCFSLGLPLAPQHWEGLSLVVGLSIANSLDASGDQIQIKWPNDLWHKNSKLAGILVEVCAMQAPPEPAARYCVIGVGVNIETPQLSITPARPLPSATPIGLRAWQPEASPAGALARIASPLLSQILRFEREGFAPFKTAYAARDALHGQALITSDGLQGLGAGVDAAGALLVHTSSGQARITSQEVSVRPQNT